MGDEEERVIAEAVLAAGHTRRQADAAFEGRRGYEQCVGLRRLAIDRVEAVQVNPMGEFGGWGLRWAPGGGFGVVLRSGPGIRVRRTGGKVFTVTVDDAATGAALLEALRVRALAR